MELTEKRVREIVLEELRKFRLKLARDHGRDAKLAMLAASGNVALFEQASNQNRRLASKRRHPKAA